jgi:exodeoxyribonuclease VII small subunit
MTNKMTYETAMRELEEIVSGIEEENISIDELSKQVKRATELIEFCKSKLYKTEEDVKKVLEGLAKN